MKKNIVFTAVALAGSLALAPHAWAQQYDQQQRSQQRQQQPGYTGQQQKRQQQTNTTQQQSRYSQQLAAVDDVKDMKIQNAQGEDLGSIDKVVVDTQQGRIAYLVVSTGGLWGLGGEKAIVPWNAFQMRQGRDREAENQVLVLNLPKEQLKNAPHGDFETVLTDRDQARQVHQFYGVSPYWEEGGQKSQRGMKDHDQMMKRQQQPAQKQLSQ